MIIQLLLQYTVQCFRKQFKIVFNSLDMLLLLNSQINVVIFSQSSGETVLLTLKIADVIVIVGLSIVEFLKFCVLIVCNQTLDEQLFVDTLISRGGSCSKLFCAYSKYQSKSCRTAVSYDVNHKDKLVNVTLVILQSTMVCNILKYDKMQDTISVHIKVIGCNEASNAVMILRARWQTW